MRVASRPVDTASHGLGVRDAWTAFWQDPGQSRCVAGAPDIWHVLTRHWSAFAHSLPQGARVLDLGCGAGAVARELVDSRPDLQVTGIDFARIPLTLHAQIDLLSDTAMENLPFAEGSWLGYGHTVPMPVPPLAASPFSTFLLLPPAVAADRHLFDNLHLHGHGIETLVVHLLSDAEYDLVRSDEGLDVFLDLLDVHHYPQVFDPSRSSYL